MRELPWRPPKGPLVIHAVRGDARMTLCAARPPRGLVLRTPEQATFFLDFLDRCPRCAGLAKRLHLDQPAPVWVPR